MTELHFLPDVQADDREFTIVVRAPLAIIRWRAPRPTIELCCRAFVRLLTHADFQPHFGVVSDWSRATADAGPDFHRDFLSALERLQTRGRLRGRWATVVPASAQMIDLYRAGRTIEMMGRPLGLRYNVFVRYDDAVSWAANREHASAGHCWPLDTKLPERNVTNVTWGDFTPAERPHLRARLRKRSI